MNEHIIIKPSLHELAARHLTLADGEIAIVEERRYVPKAEWDMGGGLFNNYGEEYPTRRVLAAFPRTEDGRRAALAGLADMERDVVHRRAEIDATLEEATRTAEAERRERIERGASEKRCATCVWSVSLEEYPGVFICTKFNEDGLGMATPPKQRVVCRGEKFDNAGHKFHAFGKDHGCAHHDLDEHSIN